MSSTPLISCSIGVATVSEATVALAAGEAGADDAQPAFLRGAECDGAEDHGVLVVDNQDVFLSLLSADGAFGDEDGGIFLAGGDADARKEALPEEAVLIARFAVDQ